ncbi:MAG: glycosyltransferase family 4 protein [Patescibacteria group bacterium]|nr:glycosyltransferase family 4 protein [Patescibacteria group bacterium]
MSKKVLMFSTAYYPFVGGAEVAVKEITDRLTDIEFHMITAKMDKNLAQKEKIGNITVFRVGIGHPMVDKVFFAFFGQYMAKKLNKQGNYDSIWAIMASYAGLAASKFKKSNPQVPFLLTLQEGDSQKYIQKRTKFIKGQFENIFKRADQIQCISNYLADWAKTLGAQCPIEVIPNGVDIKVFSQTSSIKDLRKLEQELGKQLEDRFIIHTGRLTYKNGLDYLIKALTYLPDNIKLILIGDGEDKTNLEKITTERNLEDRVIFISYIKQDELVKYLKISDIFIRPSLSEGLGNSFLEAMITKTPVIATSVGGIPDFLKDNETGLFCQVKDPESIAEKVKFLLGNQDLRDRVVKQAYQMVVKEYDWEKIAREMKEMILFTNREKLYDAKER